MSGSSPENLLKFLGELKDHCNSLHHRFPLKVNVKGDNTPVTEIDHDISNFFRDYPGFKNFHFYSEEEHSHLEFPSLVLDPLDGTKELVEGRPECAVSAAWMKSPKIDEAKALIYNPFTGLAVLDHELSTTLGSKSPTGVLSGMVSRTEWDKGLYTGFQDNQFSFQARGSIAFKLALLALGSCDFVVSLKPKHIWDIAGGTVLCHRRGLEFWSEGKRMTELKEKKLKPPLIWAHPAIMDKLHTKFSSHLA